jgi:hypothetical protein
MSDKLEDLISSLKGNEIELAYSSDCESIE